ncbi:hypothetical protein L208DRAFT_1259687, partial [Tricholoma matsutake]
RNCNKALKDATLYFSCGTPNLPTVIPAMDHINTVFTNAILPSSKTHPSVHTAIKITKQTLNKYYSLMDPSELYRITMVLHPHHKLVYFKATGWDQDWINIAKGLVQDQFESHYGTLPMMRDQSLGDKGGNASMATKSSVSHI